jgi:hypothetical protein
VYRAALDRARFGDWKIVHQRFSRWAKFGFERIFKLLASDPDVDALGNPLQKRKESAAGCQ